MCAEWGVFCGCCRAREHDGWGIPGGIQVHLSGFSLEGSVPGQGLGEILELNRFAGFSGLILNGIKVCNFLRVNCSRTLRMYYHQVYTIIFVCQICYLLSLEKICKLEPTDF